MAKGTRKKNTVGKAVDKAKKAMSTTTKPEAKPGAALVVSEKKEVAVKSTAPASVKADVKKEEPKAAPKPEVKTEVKEAPKKESAVPAKTSEKPAAKAPVKKAPAKKTTAAKKPATKRTTTNKPAGPTFDTFLEYNGEQINVTPEQIRARIEDAYKEEGHRPGNIKSIKVYLNLDERRAYYVINDKPENKFVEI